MKRAGIPLGRTTGKLDVSIEQWRMGFVSVSNSSDATAIKVRLKLETVQAIGQVLGTAVEWARMNEVQAAEGARKLGEVYEEYWREVRTALAEPLPDAPEGGRSEFAGGGEIPEPDPED